MVHGGGDDAIAAAEEEGLIAPKKLPNPCIEDSTRMELHRELLFNQKIGKNVLNQRSELQKALIRHKEKQTLNQIKDHKETPELERAIAERARRLEALENGSLEQSDQLMEPGVNPEYCAARARLRAANTNIH